MRVDVYQKIYSVIQKKVDDLDKIDQIIAILYNLSEYEVNRLPLKKFQRYADRVTKIVEPKARPRKLLGFRMVDSIEKISLGQYIEVQHFIRSGIVPSLHLIAASITSPFFRRNNPKQHRQVSEYYLARPFAPVYASVCAFLSELSKFNKQFEGLFGEAPEEGERSSTDPFLSNWGWFYSAKKIAEFKSIDFDEALRLPLTEAFTILVYLKDLKTFEDHLNKKAHANY
jgi:hypothetical protein